MDLSVDFSHLLILIGVGSFFSNPKSCKCFKMCNKCWSKIQLLLLFRIASLKVEAMQKLWAALSNRWAQLWRCHKNTKPCYSYSSASALHLQKCHNKAKRKSQKQVETGLATGLILTPSSSSSSNPCKSHNKSGYGWVGWLIVGIFSIC